MLKKIIRFFCYKFFLIVCLCGIYKFKIVTHITVICVTIAKKNIAKWIFTADLSIKYI